jgi:hypothetical protein
MGFMGSVACDPSVVEYGLRADVQRVLASERIECLQYRPEPPAISACSFAGSTPDPGLTISVVMLYPDAESAEAAFDCRPGAGGQVLFREGQSWLASIAAVADDRVTNSDITDQAFVDRVAELLGTDVVGC